MSEGKRTRHTRPAARLGESDHGVVLRGLCDDVLSGEADAYPIEGEAT